MSLVVQVDVHSNRLRKSIPDFVQMSSRLTWKCNAVRKNPATQLSIFFCRHDWGLLRQTYDAWFRQISDKFLLVCHSELTLDRCDVSTPGLFLVPNVAHSDSQYLLKTMVIIFCVFCMVLFKHSIASDLSGDYISLHVIAWKLKNKRVLPPLRRDVMTSSTFHILFPNNNGDEQRRDSSKFSGWSFRLSLDLCHFYFSQSRRWNSKKWWESRVSYSIPCHGFRQFLFQ